MTINELLQRIYHFDDNYSKDPFGTTKQKAFVIGCSLLFLVAVNILTEIYNVYIQPNYGVHSSFMVGFVVGVVFLPIIIYVLNVIGRLSVRLFNNGRTTENPQSP